MEIHVLEVKFQPVGECLRKIIGGYNVYAWLLELFESVSPQAASDMHGEQVKRFALTPMLFRDGFYNLRVSFLEENKAASFVRALLRNPTFVISGQALQVSLVKPVKICIDENGTKPPKDFKLTFVSPTFFREGPYKDVLLPYPWLIAKSSIDFVIRASLYSRGGFDFGRDVKDFFMENMLVSACKIRTVKVKYASGRVPARGFIGWCAYSMKLKNLSEEHKSILKMLDYSLRVSELMNLGAKRAMGFGVVKYEPKTYYSQL